MNNMNTIKKHYYNSECEICKNQDDSEKNDTIIRLEKSLIRIIDEVSNDSRILTFTYNLKKKKIIGNYLRCKNTKRFIDNKQFYFDIYLNWLYYLKNNNFNQDYIYYSGKIKKLANIVYYINLEKTKSCLKYKKLNCFKAINHLESLLIFLEKNKYINFSMTNNCTSFKKLGVFDFSQLNKIKNKNNFLYTFIKFKNVFIDNNFRLTTKKQKSSDTESITSQVESPSVESLSNDSVISDMEKMILKNTEIMDDQQSIIKKQNLIIVQQNSNISKLEKDIYSFTENIRILSLQNENSVRKYEKQISFLVDENSKLKSGYINSHLDTSTSVRFPSSNIQTLSNEPIKRSHEFIVDHNIMKKASNFNKSSPSNVEASTWKTFPNNGNLDLYGNTHNESFIKPSSVPVVPPGFNESSNNLFEQNVRYQEQYTQHQHQEQYTQHQHQEQYIQCPPPLINYQGSPQVQDYNYNGW